MDEAVRQFVEATFSCVFAIGLLLALVSLLDTAVRLVHQIRKLRQKELIDFEPRLVSLTKRPVAVRIEATRQVGSAIDTRKTA